MLNSASLNLVSESGNVDYIDVSRCASLDMAIALMK
jgi:hypothetical protein